MEEEPRQAESSKKKDDGMEMTDEERELKERLELYVRRIGDKDAGVASLALESLKSEIRSSTASMTSVPKPFKYLKEHYPGLCQQYEEGGLDGGVAAQLADVLSVLAMTMGREGRRDSLHFKLRGHTADVQSWGHEYARHLSGEISAAYRGDGDDEEVRDDEPSGMQPLIEALVPYFMAHHAEHEAVDLLLEVDRLGDVQAHVDESTYDRVCEYLQAIAQYVPEPDDAVCRRVALDVYRRFGRSAMALRLALRLGDRALAEEVYRTCNSPGLQRQLAFLLARQNVFLDEDDPELAPLLHNERLSALFGALARDLSIEKVRSLDAILEPRHHSSSHHSDDAPPTSSSLTDSSTTALSAAQRQSRMLGGTYANAFVHGGFGADGLPDVDGWLASAGKVHASVRSAAVASRGLVHLWDVDAALEPLAKYLDASAEEVQAGALLGVGVASAGVRHPMDPALALICEAYEQATSLEVRKTALLGLGLAYAGTARADLRDWLGARLMDAETPAPLVAWASLALGLVCVASGDADASELVLSAVVERAEELRRESAGRLALLGLGLVYLGRQEEAAVEMQAVAASLPLELASLAEVTLDSCAYAVSGNVLKIQQFLKLCGEHSSDSPPKDRTTSEPSAPVGILDGNGAGAEGLPRGAPATVAAAAASLASSSGQEKDLLASALSMEQENPDDDSIRDSLESDSLLPKPSQEDTEDEKEKEKEKEKRKEKNVQGMDEKDKDQEKNNLEEGLIGGEYRQGVAVLGIAMAAMAEDLGREMAVRLFQHILQYGDVEVRRVVPLAIGLLYLGDPEVGPMDTLSKLSHDPDAQVSLAAILALGLIASGTNNARTANLLHALAQFYARDRTHLVVVHWAQGLLHLGKGALGLYPLNGQNMLLHRVAMAGLLVVLHAAMDLEAMVKADGHLLLFALALAMHPRMLMTLGEDLQPLSVPVRVGRAVDTLGQAGKPKTITGFLTHSTPVLFSAGDRAELAADDYVPLTSMLEGIVILKKAPSKSD